MIAAEGEQNASRALKEAADIMSEAPNALQLRYLQTLNTISAERNSTIIFPLPIDLLSALIENWGLRVRMRVSLGLTSPDPRRLWLLIALVYTTFDRIDV